MKLYIQEPRLFPLDKSFFESLHITVLESPAASTHTNGSTFLYAPFLPWTVLLTDFLTEKNPHLTITAIASNVIDSIDILLGDNASDYTQEQKDTFSQVLKKFLSQRTCKDFPQPFELDNHALMGLKVLWDEEYWNRPIEHPDLAQNQASDEGVEELISSMKKKL